jgi:hypothetical protein
MNPRTTLIAVLAFVALAVFAYTLRGTPSQQVGSGAPTPTAPPLLDLAEDAVQEVEVAAADGAYTLKRVGTGWEVDDQPASDEVATTVSSLASPAVLRELPADRKPDDYGFATPTLTVTLRTADGSESVLLVGDDAAADPQVYVMLSGGERIVLISNYEVDRLRDWLEDPPLAPTATPTEGGATEKATPTPGEGADEEPATPTPTTEEAGEASSTASATSAASAATATVTAPAARASATATATTAAATTAAATTATP